MFIIFDEIFNYISLCLTIFLLNLYDTFPYDWAKVQNSLANAYQDRIKGDRSENLEEAIEGYNGALEILTKQNFPFQWAMTENNRATAYSDRRKGDRSENLEKAIEGYNGALEVYTKQDFPIDWAMTQKNLEIALAEKAKLK